MRLTTCSGGPRRRTAAAAAAALIAAALGGCGAPQADAGAARFDERPGASYAAYIEAELLAHNGLHAEAAQRLRLAQRADSEAHALPLRLAEVLAHVDGATDEGLFAAQRALDLGADPARVAVARAELLQIAGRDDDAVDVLREAAAASPSPAVFAAWARMSSGGDDRLAAARAFTVAFPDDAEAWRQLGAAHEIAGDRPAAADAYATAAFDAGGTPRDAYRELQLVAAQEDWVALDARATRCVETFWEYWPCRSWRAVARWRLAPPSADATPDDPTADALRDLAAFVANEPRSIHAAGGELREQGGLGLSLAFAQRVAALRANDAPALVATAWVAHGAGNTDVAVEMMLRVIEVDDSNFEALNYVGYTWADAGVRLDEAEPMLRHAVSLRPNDGNILDSLAWSLYRLERHEEALEVQRRALLLEDANAVVWDHLGDIYAALGRMSDAVSAWENALLFVATDEEDVAARVPPKLERARAALVAQPAGEPPR